MKPSTYAFLHRSPPEPIKPGVGCGTVQSESPVNDFPLVNYILEPLFFVNIDKGAVLLSILTNPGWNRRVPMFEIVVLSRQDAHSSLGTVRFAL